MLGCAQKEVCKAWAKYGQKNVEPTRDGFGDVLSDNLLMARNDMTPDAFKKMVHTLLDLTLSDFEAERLAIEYQYGEAANKEE